MGSFLWLYFYFFVFHYVSYAMFVISYFMHFLCMFVLSPDFPFGCCVSNLVNKEIN